MIKEVYVKGDKDSDDVGFASPTCLAINAFCSHASCN